MSSKKRTRTSDAIFSTKRLKLSELQAKSVTALQERKSPLVVSENPKNPDHKHALWVVKLINDNEELRARVKKQESAFNDLKIENLKLKAKICDYFPFLKTILLISMTMKFVGHFVSTESLWQLTRH